MVGSRTVLAVTGVCGLLQVAHATLDAHTSFSSVPSIRPFFSQSDPTSGSDAAFASVFSPEERVAVQIDRDAVWQRYYAHLMARTRDTPFVVFFTDDARDCEALAAEDDEEDDRERHRAEVATCEKLRDHTAAVSAQLRAVITARTEFPSQQVLPVVHIATSELPVAFAQHRVPATPSLMWFPPRSTGRLQRYPHQQTNFLALTSPSDSVAETATAFLRRSYAQSGLPFPSANAVASPKPVAALEDTLVAKLLNLLPFLAILLYTMLMAVEHRAVVLRVLGDRFTWLVLAQFVLYVSLSGLFHSIIHRTPLLYAHPQFGVYLIHPSGRKQFFLEGLVNGSWSFLVSFGLFSIASVVPKIRSTFAREEIFRWSLLLVGGAYMGMYLIFAAKHPWLSR